MELDTFRELDDTFARTLCRDGRTIAVGKTFTLVKDFPEFAGSLHVFFPVGNGGCASLLAQPSPADCMGRVRSRAVLVSNFMGVTGLHK